MSPLHAAPTAGFDAPFELMGACHERMARTLALLARHKEIQIVSDEGGYRHSASTIKDTDRLILPRQTTLLLSR